MNARTVRYAVNMLLLAAVVTSVATGFVADQLDLRGFAVHRWAGYALAAFAGAHIAMNWRGFLPSRRAVSRAGSSASVSTPAAAPMPSRRTALVGAGAGTAGAVLGWSARATSAPTRFPGGDVGLFYHRESSLGLRGLVGDLIDWGRRPPQYKQVSGAEPVPLPTVVDPPQMSVAQAVGRRRSLRTFADRALTAEELAWVVGAAASVTSGDGLRTAPSAGALYPVETYVAVEHVTGVEAGLYHVDVQARSLHRVRAGSVSGDLLVAGLGQEFLRQAPAVLVLTGVFQRTRWKYRQRHYRYVCWEGGHIAQNVYLAAEAAGLGACMVGAFLDGTLNALVQVDGREEAALGLIAIGAR